MIWLDDVGCSGNESCLLSCSRNGIGDSNCSHVEDVAIFCSGSPSSSTNCSFINSKFTYMYILLHAYSVQIQFHVVICTPLHIAGSKPSQLPHAMLPYSLRSLLNREGQAGLAANDIIISLLLCVPPSSDSADLS